MTRATSGAQTAAGTKQSAGFFFGTAFTPLNFQSFFKAMPGLALAVTARALIVLCQAPLIVSGEISRDEFIQFSEAEMLLSPGHYISDGAPEPITYSHASGESSVYLRGGKLTWTTELKEGGACWLWLRGRCGWSQDHFFGAETYRLQIGLRSVRLTAQRDTLDYYGDGENFVWFRSEPLNLDAGEVKFTVFSDWSWAHVDCLGLTCDADYKPSKGNIALSLEKIDSALDIWRVEPSVPFHPRQMTPPEKLPGIDIKLTAPRNGTVYGSFAVRARDSSPGVAHLIIHWPKLKSAAGNVLPEDWITVRRLAVTGIRAGLLAADALPELDRLGYVEICPGQTACFWVEFAIPAEAETGTFTGGLVIENQAALKSVTVPLELRIMPLTLPDSAGLAVFNWWGYGNSPRAWWDDQIAHGINTFKFLVHNEIGFRFGADGEMEGACDFSRLAKFIEAQRRTGGYLLAEWSFHSPKNLRLECGAPGVPAGAPLEFMSGPWRRAFHSLLTQMNSHLESRGVPRDRILHYIFDEYLGDKFIQTGRLIRQINPEYKIFGDLSADLDTYQKAAPYVDIWCPHFSSLELMDRDGRLEFLRSTGKPIWCYDEGYNQRASDPRAKFRRKFWIAFRYKLDGCAYWKHQGDSVGTAYYPVRGQQPVTSRRYEEWCSGLQDYKLLKMLEKQTEPDSPRAVEAGKLMREAVAEVIAHPEQASLADKYRERILIFLSETGTP